MMMSRRVDNTSRYRAAQGTDGITAAPAQGLAKEERKTQTNASHNDDVGMTLKEVSKPWRHLRKVSRTECRLASPALASSDSDEDSTLVFLGLFNFSSTSLALASASASASIFSFCFKVTRVAQLALVPNVTPVNGHAHDAT